MCQELNLFSWSEKKEAYTIDEISDTEGWKEVRNHMCNSIADAKFKCLLPEYWHNLALANVNKGLILFPPAPII